MFIADLTSQLLRAMKDLGFNNSNLFKIDIDANERKKHARVNIVIENKPKDAIGFWACFAEKLMPYIIILVLGCILSCKFFRLPTYCESDVSANTEEHISTNLVGETIKTIHNSKSITTNKWE